MSHRTYCLVSGILFSAVSLAHLLRLIYRLPVSVDEYAVPMFVSWFAFIVPALLAVWALRLATASSTA